MKTLFPTLLFLFSVNFALAVDRVPSDVQRVFDIRSNEFKRINEQYIAALERLKKRYTKKGDLETALIIDDQIKAVGTQNIDNQIKAVGTKDIVGVWTLWGEGIKKPYKFESDGTFTGYYARGEGKMSGTWRKLDIETTLRLKIDKGPLLGTYYFTVSSDGTGTLRGTHGDLVGKKI